MYAICRTQHPPTEVELCLYCNFYNSEERNLVVAGATQLKVFRLISESENGNAEPNKVRLECRQTFSLFGNIQSIDKVRLTNSVRDALLLTFNEAKLSVVEYDPNTHDLKTLSLHYFEEEEMKTGITQFSQIPVVRVDPEGRCAAMLIFGRNIIILPFRKDVAVDEQDIAGNIAVSTNIKSPVLASYKLDLDGEQFVEKINNIIDIQFLPGYYEPTLLILHEPVRTWSGRVAVRQDTCAMVVLSLNVHQHVHPPIWSVSRLPYDCFKAVPVPRPVGGVLIFCVNSLIYLNQSIPPYGASLNGFNEGSTQFSLKAQDDVKISLDCSNSCFLTNDKLVISVKTGDLYVLTLFNDGMRSIRGFSFEKSASSVLTTCVTACEQGFLFLGSRLGNSLLLKYTEKLHEPNQNVNSSDHLNELDASDSLGNDSLLPMKTEKETSDSNIITEKEEKEPSIKEEEEEEENENKEESDKGNNESASQDDEEEPAVKKIKQEKPEEEENIENWFAGDVNLIEDPDILEVYGVQPNVSVMNQKHTTFVFEICDAIINLGPCGKICMGEPATNFRTDDVSGGPDVELVTTSGFAKNGALCVLQRTIRPQIVATYELQGCTDMWTVYGPPSSSKVTIKEGETTAENLNENECHAFLILSRADSTMVLQTGREINELDQSGFSCQTPTVFAGNLGNNRYILQVSPMAVTLLDGDRQIERIPLDLGAPICTAFLVDPYAVLLASNGVILLLRLKSDSSDNAALGVSKPQLSTAKSKIVTLSIYKDVSGTFTTEKKIDINSIKTESDTETKPKTVPNVASFSAFSTETIDDEDELLYGDSTLDDIHSYKAPTIKSEIAEPTDEKPTITEPKIYEVKPVEPTFWLFIVRENGVMEVYSLPDFRFVYIVKNFPMGPKVLVDSIQSTDQLGLIQQDISNLPVTNELLVIGMGVKETRPILFARFDDELFIYEAFPYFETQVEHHLKVRFKKIPHNIIVKEPKSQLEKIEDSSEVGVKRSFLRFFKDISGYSGVFLCGPYPYWFFMTSRGELRIHEMNVDGAIPCFTEFNNINCQKGFLYFNQNESLRIALLPTHLSYDSVWPVRKVPLRCTPHFVNYHVDTKTYCLVASTLETMRKFVRIGGEEKDYELLERDDKYIYPTSEKFILQLISPVSWEVIPGTRMELDEWEHVTCLKNVMLASEGTTTGLKGYIAMGTNYNYGEDVTNRGRIWILDIIDVVPEPGQPLTRNKIKIVYCKEQKGPVTTLCQVKGFLLSAIGQKIYIWQLKESQLIGIAFIDTQIYIHSAVSLKNLILVADVYKSVLLLRYQEETRTLSLVSKDTRSLQVYGADYLIDNSNLCFVVSDIEKNIILFMYQPENRESLGGTRLIRRGDFHFGSRINSFFRISCKVPNYVKDKRLKQSVINKHITQFATLDGGLGYILPISEKTYRRLLMLQNVLTTSLPHTAGLNPKSFRAIKVRKHELLNPLKNILDGDLLFKYLSLSMNEKNELAKKIGTTPIQVCESY